MNDFLDKINAADWPEGVYNKALPDASAIETQLKAAMNADYTGTADLWNAYLKHKADNGESLPTTWSLFIRDFRNYVETNDGVLTTTNQTVDAEKQVVNITTKAPTIAATAYQGEILTQASLPRPLDDPANPPFTGPDLGTLHDNYMVVQNGTGTYALHFIAGGGDATEPTPPAIPPGTLIVPVGISTTATAADVAIAVEAAIDGIGGGLSATISPSGSNRVVITDTVAGARPHISSGSTGFDIRTIAPGRDEASLIGEYFFLGTPGNQIGIWFSDGATTLPPIQITSVMGITAVEVDISSATTANDVASALNSALTSLEGTIFSSTPDGVVSSGNVVTLIANLAGEADQPHPGSVNSDGISDFLSFLVPTRGSEEYEKTLQKSSYEGPFVAFKDIFEEILGYDLQDGNLADTNFKEGEDFFAAVLGPGATNEEKAQLLDLLFKESFSAFLKQFDTSIFTTASGNDTKFVQQWSQWMTVTQIIFNDTRSVGSFSTLTTPGGRGASGDLPAFPSYEDAFRTVFGDMYSTEAALMEAFQSRLEVFVNNRAALDGFFIPSHHSDEWGAALVAEADHLYPQGLSDDERARRTIVFVLFDLLIIVMQRLQRTVQVQGQHLIFLTEWQKQYTDLMGRVPLYQGNPPRLLGPRDRPKTNGGWAKIIEGLALSAQPLLVDGVTDDVSSSYTTEKNVINFLQNGLDSALWLNGIGNDLTLNVPDVNQNNPWDPDDPDSLTNTQRNWVNDPHFDTPGFAGITLREIHQQIRDGSLTIFSTLGGSGPLAGYANAFADNIPGVWWVVEQPYGTDFEDVWGIDLQKAQAERSSINDVRNAWIEKLRSSRNIIRDEAKQAQSNLSQTKESINQQAQLLTSIIQMMSGIIQSIFR